MKQFNFFLTGLLAVLIILSSCKKEDIIISDSEKITEQFSQSSEGLIVLGKELEDPYALKNIQQAYENLKSLKQDTPDLALEPTHIYIRFLPKNEEEWSLLKRDTSILFFDFPLNYEIADTAPITTTQNSQILQLRGNIPYYPYNTVYHK